MKTPQVWSCQWEAEEKIHGAQCIGDALVPNFVQGPLVSCWHCTEGQISTSIINEQSEAGKEIPFQLHVAFLSVTWLGTKDSG